MLTFHIDRTIAINISMNALDYSLDEFHVFLLRIRYEILIPVHVASVLMAQLESISM